jgi:hypothetical protein
VGNFGNGGLVDLVKDQDRATTEFDGGEALKREFSLFAANEHLVCREAVIGRVGFGPHDFSAMVRQSVVG